MTPIDQISDCKTVDELFDLWKANIGRWKSMRDFDKIAEAKDERKFSLTWPVTLENAMRRYNECCDQFDIDTTVEDAIRLIDEGRTLEQQIAELVARVIAEKYPIDATGLRLVNMATTWQNFSGHVKFELEGE
jgi:hypothetical protein